MTTEMSPSLIAVVGMACRFPGARTVEGYWRLLADGLEGIRPLAHEELLSAGIDSRLLERPDYIRAAATLDDIELFDAELFGFTPREAAMLDPQHRLFLECAWEALHAAACEADDDAHRTGVFAGAGLNQYRFLALAAQPDWSPEAKLALTLANDSGCLTTRVSYKLDLRGPSLSVQTGCSTSLVAVHLACESLLRHESDTALAGGVSIRLPHICGYLYQQGGMASDDGHCRAFDKRAHGTVFGSGVGVVVLKRLEDAVAGGHHISAVIRSTAVNNDGSNKIGYTAPSIEGQEAVIRDAHELAMVDPATIGFVEGHGTATRLGDPIEVAALTRVFGAGPVRPGSCALGSAKGNIGHLDAAAGIAGFIKTALALEHRRIPPTLHFEEPNPEIDFSAGPFFVNNRLIDWPPGHESLRAGVSAFGMGGTNVHVVLEEAPPPVMTSAGRPTQLLVLSASKAARVGPLAASLAEYLRAHPEVDLADVAWTLKRGRRARSYRCAVIAHDRSEAIAGLSTFGSRQVPAEARPGLDVAFLFPGQGALSTLATRDLYRTEPIFRAEIDGCAALLKGRCVPGVLEAFDSLNSEHPAETSDTAVVQPVLFAIAYSLSRLWHTWGVTPAALMGHSLGEYVAACVSGVLTLEDALMLVAERGRLMASQPAGAMTAISESVEVVQSVLQSGLSIAAINGRKSCVVSGPPDAVAAVEARFPNQTFRLETSRAFHSSMMEPILEPFRDALSRVRFGVPRIPIFSTVTGGRLSAEEATSVDYWLRQVRDPVLCAATLDAMCAAWPNVALLEIGPGQTLVQIARRHLGPKLPIVASFEPATERRSHASGNPVYALGRLWEMGLDVDWPSTHQGEQRRRVALPSPPLLRQRHWMADPIVGRDTGATFSAEPDSQKISQPAINCNECRTASPQTSPDDVVELITRQLAVVSQQLELLR